MERSHISTLYTSDEYITKNPDLHKQDSAWKVKKLLPLIDQFAKEFNGREITILDVGGGAGVILKELSKHLEIEHDRKIIKYCLDLSPGMLEVQHKNNPDSQVIQGDIAHTDLDKKQADLLLMIDVLEHVADTERVLAEIARVSKYALFKVPLEDTLYYKMMDFITRGKFRKRIVDSIGHVNVYNAASLKQEIEKHCGKVIAEDFTNVYSYLWRKKDESLVSKIFNLCGSLVHSISPPLAARLFNDYRIIFVECY